jgi:hypothetical protein
MVLSIVLNPDSLLKMMVMSMSMMVMPSEERTNKKNKEELEETVELQLLKSLI